MMAHCTGNRSVYSPRKIYKVHAWPKDAGDLKPHKIVLDFLSSLESREGLWYAHIPKKEELATEITDKQSKLAW